MKPLNAREAYRLWAPVYAEETAVSILDEELTHALSPAIHGLRLLDAGCGIGRRIRETHARVAVGIDLSLDMLIAGGRTDVAVADVRALPFAAESFDVIWCRLVLGHIAGIETAFRQFARVCRIGGYLLATDFHPRAAAAGHQRSFRDASGILHSVEHHVHSEDDYRTAAVKAGFTLTAKHDGAVGPLLESIYRRNDRAEAYERDIGLPLVAGFLYRRTV